MMVFVTQHQEELGFVGVGRIFENVFLKLYLLKVYFVKVVFSYIFGKCFYCILQKCILNW